MVRTPVYYYAAGVALLVVLSQCAELQSRRSASSPGAALAATARKRSAKKKTPSRAKARSRRLKKQVTATAYCLGPCRRCQTRGRTYTGTRGRRGVAVARLGSRRAVPLGSRVYVPGYGWARVDDVGGGVGRRQIDLRFVSCRKAQQWGRRAVDVVAEVRGGA